MAWHGLVLKWALIFAAIVAVFLVDGSIGQDHHLVMTTAEANAD